MNQIPLTYNPKQVCDANSFSQSPGKAAPLVSAWAASELVAVQQSRAATRADIALAHDQRYVAGVLDRRLRNGFDNNSAAVAVALPYQVGSLIDACALVAFDPKRTPVACSPTSGFHHAHYDRGGDYCTFNGLLIAAQWLVLNSMAKRVGILDCDYHFGDGTTQILQRLRLPHDHWTAGAHYRDASQAKDFLAGLSTTVKSFKGVDLLIYQAGADQHIDDPLGGMLTTEQMAERDRIVFWTCREYRIPMVWNLAGGYQTDESGTIQPVLDLHNQTMQQCHDIYVLEKERRP